MEKTTRTTRAEKKEQALVCLKGLQVAKPYIEDFEQNDKVYVFENLYGYPAPGNEDVFIKLKEIEKKYKCLVYAVIHSEMYFGDCYNFLLVPDDPEDWEWLLRSNIAQHNVLAYVWNRSYEPNSEMGTISCLSMAGGLTRAA